jgi:molecular chaperone DnaK
MITQLFVPYLEKQFGVKDLASKMLSAGGKYNKLYYQLLYRAEEAKIGLSNHPRVDIEFDFTDEGGEVEEVFFTISRAQFDGIVRDKVVYSLSFIRELLERNRLHPGDITEVVLVGGSTYIPLIRSMLAEELGIMVNTSIDPTTAVVEGAAYYAGSKTSKLERGPRADGSGRAPGASEDARGGSVGSGAGGDAGGAKEAARGSGRTAGKGGSGTGGTDASGAKGAAREGGPSIEVKLAYQPNSREQAEYFAASVMRAPRGSRYRIMRSDGGYDSGLKPVAERISEMLVLLPNTMNTFQLRLYDEKGGLLDVEVPEIGIVHGMYSIYGQPLPNDICLEVDDTDNNVTHLEVIFERNTILPIRKSVTKTLSRTIAKGSDDQLLINVLEGSRYSLPQSNLPIGIISISGRQLSTDLVKGCDIDLSFEITESRDITVTAYISMIDEEFRQAFSPSSRTVNVARMREEVDYLYRVSQRQLDNLLQRELYEEGAALQRAMSELETIRQKLRKISEDDVTDTKYQLDDQKRKLAKVIDISERGGKILVLKEEYFGKKERYRELLAQSGNSELLKRLEALGKEENEWMSHCSAQFLRWKINEMDRMTWDVKKRDIGYVTNLYLGYAIRPNEDYSDINEIKMLKKRGDEALTRRNPDEIISIIYRMYELLIDKDADEEIRGTGLR